MKQADRYAAEFAAAMRWLKAERVRSDRSQIMDWCANDAFLVTSHSPWGIGLAAWLTWRSRTPLWKRAVARVWYRLGGVHPSKREFVL